MLTNFNLNMKVVLVLFLSVSIWICEGALVRTESNPLKCHICDPDTCKNFNPKSEPQECTTDKLQPENSGPSKLSEFSYIRHVPLDDPNPLFACQKIDAFDQRGNLFVLRKCQLRLSGNASCTMFQQNVNNDRERTYTNTSCYLCETDGCNGTSFLYVWCPMIVLSIILSLFCK